MNNRNFLKFFIWTIVAIIVCAVIFMFSHQNGESSGNVSKDLTDKLFGFHLLGSHAIFVIEKIIRKIAHFGIYFTLGVSVYSALHYFNLAITDKRALKCGIVLVSLCICFMYSLTDELHQSFIPGRNGSFLDCLLDTFGSFSGITLIRIMYALRKNHK